MTRYEGRNAWIDIRSTAPKREGERERQSVSLSVAPRVSNMLSWVGLDLRQAGRQAGPRERASVARALVVFGAERGSERKGERTGERRGRSEQRRRMERRKEERCGMNDGGGGGIGYRVRRGDDMSLLLGLPPSLPSFPWVCRWVG